MDCFLFFHSTQKTLLTISEMGRISTTATNNGYDDASGYFERFHPIGGNRHHKQLLMPWVPEIKLLHETMNKFYLWQHHQTRIPKIYAIIKDEKWN